MKTKFGLVLAGALVLLFPALGAAQECREEFIFCPEGPVCCCASLKPPQCGLSVDDCYWYCNGVISANDSGTQPELAAIFAAC
jgi:hypothetical protein